VADLGGADALSAQQRGLVQLAARTYLYVNHLDAWLMEQPSLVINKRKAVLPVLKERTQLADALSRYLQALGLERQAKTIPSLADYLSGKVQSAPKEEPK
jgi:hypothetical protein